MRDDGGPVVDERTAGDYKNCPFCGSSPFVGGWSNYPMLSCGNPNCAASKLRMNKAHWNHRAVAEDREVRDE